MCVIIAHLFRKLFIRIANVMLSHDIAHSTTLGTAATDAIPNIYFQSRIDTNIQQHVDPRLFFYSR